MLETMHGAAAGARDRGQRERRGPPAPFTRNPVRTRVVGGTQEPERKYGGEDGQQIVGHERRRFADRHALVCR